MKLSRAPIVPISLAFASLPVAAQFLEDPARRRLGQGRLPRAKLSRISIACNAPATGARSQTGMIG